MIVATACISNAVAVRVTLVVRILRTVCDARAVVADVRHVVSISIKWTKRIGIHLLQTGVGFVAAALKEIRVERVIELFGAEIVVVRHQVLANLMSHQVTITENGGVVGAILRSDAASRSDVGKHVAACSDEEADSRKGKEYIHT